MSYDQLLMVYCGLVVKLIYSTNDKYKIKEIKSSLKYEQRMLGLQNITSTDYSLWLMET